MTGTTPHMDRDGNRALRTVVLWVSLLVTMAVLALVSWVAASERSFGWNGPAVALALASGMGVLLAITGAWRHTPVWIGEPGRRSDRCRLGAGSTAYFRHDQHGRWGRRSRRSA